MIFLVLSAKARLQYSRTAATCRRRQGAGQSRADPVQRPRCGREEGGGCRPARRGHRPAGRSVQRPRCGGEEGGGGRPARPAPVNPPTLAPVNPPTLAPVDPPTLAPVNPPTAAPIDPPTPAPVNPPTAAPIDPPTLAPVNPPTTAPVNPPTLAPVEPPTAAPVNPPTLAPVNPPTLAPVNPPTAAPIIPPTAQCSSPEDCDTDGLGCTVDECLGDSTCKRTPACPTDYTCVEPICLGGCTNCDGEASCTQSNGCTWDKVGDCVDPPSTCQGLSQAECASDWANGCEWTTDNLVCNSKDTCGNCAGCSWSNKNKKCQDSSGAECGGTIEQCIGAPIGDPCEYSCSGDQDPFTCQPPGPTCGEPGVPCQTSEECCNKCQTKGRNPSYTCG